MTDQSRTFSDEVLTAFLDGEAAQEDVRAIETALEQDSALADRMLALDIPKQAIAAQFDALLTSAPPLPILPPAPSLRVGTQDVADIAADHPVVVAPFGGRRWIGPSLGLGTGIAAGIAMALGFGWSLQPPAQATPAKGWIAAVAQYQALYTSETLKANGPVRTESLAVVSEAVGLDLTALANVDGLTFQRAQELGFNGKALIQIAYTLPDGTPFAICILRNDKAAGATRYHQVEGLQAADWNTGSHGILLIGGQDAEIMQTIAPKVDALL